MIDSDRAAFAQIMIVNGEVYDIEISDARMRIYFSDLSGYSIEQIEDAFRRHRMDPDRGRYRFPYPADIVAQIDGSLADRGDIAWMEVVGALTDASTASQKINDPVIDAIVNELGGYRRLGTTSGYDLTNIRRAFIASYVRAIKYAEPTVPETDLHLIGDGS